METMEIQWPLVLFTSISAAGGWTFAFACLNHYTKRAKSDMCIYLACIVGAALLAIGGIASVTHLTHVDHVLWVFQHPAEGIFMEVLLLSIDAILMVLYFLLVRRRVKGPARPIVATLGILMGPIFSYMCGSSYMMESQLVWKTYFLPLGYMGTAVPSGAAIWMLINFLFKEKEPAIKLCALEMLCASVVSICLGFAYAKVSGNLTGDLALLYWVLIFGLAGLVPLAGGLLVRRFPKLCLYTSIACIACTLVGSTCYRILMWLGNTPLMSLFGEVV